MQKRFAQCAGIVSAVIFSTGCRRRHRDAVPITSDSVAKTAITDSDPRAHSELLATGTSPIAVGPSSVAFMGHPSGGSSAAQLFEVSKNGGTPILRTQVHWPRGFALDERGLYFLDESPNALYFVASGTATKKVVADDRYYGHYYKDEDFIVLRDGFVYWLTGPTSQFHVGGVVRMRETGGIPSVVAEQPSDIGGIAVYGQRLYLTAYAGVQSYPVEGGTPTTLSAAAIEDRGCGEIAVNATHVYWLSFDHDSKDMFWRLSRVPVDGGAREVLIERPRSPRRFALTAHAIYWVNEHELHRADLDGGNDLILDDADGWAIVADETNVYYSKTSEILRIAQ